MSDNRHSIYIIVASEVVLTICNVRSEKIENIANFQSNIQITCQNIEKSSFLAVILST